MESGIYTVRISGEQNSSGFRMTATFAIDASKPKLEFYEYVYFWMILQSGIRQYMNTYKLYESVKYSQGMATPHAELLSRRSLCRLACFGFVNARGLVRQNQMCAKF